MTKRDPIRSLFAVWFFPLRRRGFDFGDVGDGVGRYIQRSSYRDALSEERLDLVGIVQFVRYCCVTLQQGSRLLDGMLTDKNL